MKYENSVTIFIFTLLASLFLFFISSMSGLGRISFYGEIISVIFFAISLIGMFIASLKITSTRWLSYLYYLLLFIVAIVMLFFRVFYMEISNITRYYFVLAVLIALLLSILDIKRYFLLRIRALRRFKILATSLEQKVAKLEADLKKANSDVEKLRLMIVAKDEEIKAEKEKAAALARAEKKSRKERAEAVRTAGMYKSRNEKLTDQKKKVDELTKEKAKLEREVSSKEKEITKQAELKAKYSKTLNGIRKRKKEDQELLVVSEDGSSVHRPKCISVRNVTKENRKLIKNWKTAKKEGYKGCGLCKPHEKDEVIVRKGVKYKFLGAKDSDKVHKASCVLIKNIDEKDRKYFRSYRAAVKAKYTACRVCNPEQ
jgi:hypothetical protein